MSDFKLVSNTSDCLDAELTIGNEMYNYLKYKIGDVMHIFISRSVIVDEKSKKYQILGSYYVEEIKENKVHRSSYNKKELNDNIEKYRDALSRFVAYFSFM